MDTQKEDVFRQNYTPLTDGQKELMSQIKSKAQELYEFTIVNGSTPNNTPELTWFQTRLEEAIMWAIKGITK